MTIEVLISGNSQITIGGHPYSIKAHYGIKPQTFIDYYTNLTEKYSLNLRRIEFEDEILTENGFQKVKVRPLQEYVSFIIYTNILEKKGLDISDLIRQIAGGRDYYVIRHAKALTELAYIYLNNGYDIKIQSKGADFVINGINADVKVAQPSVLKKIRRNSKIHKDGYLDISNEILLAILQMMKSRFLKGVKQADLLFFNLTGSVLFSSLGLFINEFDRIVPPQNNRLVIYSDHFYCDGADLHHQIGSAAKYLGKRLFPDLISIKGYFIDFDPYLWKFLSQFEIK